MLQVAVSVLLATALTQAPPRDEPPRAHATHDEGLRDDVIRALVGSGAGVVAAAGTVALGGLGVLAVTAGFMALVVTRGGFQPEYLGGLLVDSALYLMLFSLFAVGPTLLAALSMDALAFVLATFALSPRRAWDVVAPLAAVGVVLPALVLMLPGAVTFLVWLTVAPLPDVLMLVGGG
ncbi:MAG: hypothetical protein AB2A00_17590, partial [Myxococcota bacterium]